MFVRTSPRSGEFSNENMGFGSRCKRFPTGTRVIGTEAAEKSHSKALTYKTIAAACPVESPVVIHKYNPTRVVARENFSTLIGQQKLQDAEKRKATKFQIQKRPASGTGERQRFTAAGVKVDPTNGGPGAYLPDRTDITTRPVTPQYNNHSVSGGNVDNKGNSSSNNQHNSLFGQQHSRPVTPSTSIFAGGLVTPSSDSALKIAPATSDGGCVPAGSASRRPLSGSICSSTTGLRKRRPSSCSVRSSESIIDPNGPHHRNSLTRARLLSGVPSGEFDHHHQRSSSPTSHPETDGGVGAGAADDFGIRVEESIIPSPIAAVPRTSPQVTQGAMRLGDAIAGAATPIGARAATPAGLSSTSDKPPLLRPGTAQPGGCGRPVTPESFTYRPDTHPCRDVWKLPFATKAQLKNAAPSAFALASEKITARDSFMTLSMAKNSLGMLKSQEELRLSSKRPLTYLQSEPQVKLSANVLVQQQQKRVTAADKPHFSSSSSAAVSRKPTKKKKKTAVAQSEEKQHAIVEAEPSTVSSEGTM